ncbi:hypothetical protein [Burkholderia ubonensis]|uniref:hypothetical protein n=1 Tax=Burkholderia ubonensis TaxID=101571 RepID=UPI00075EDB75|nr:hypothetical protein [Burkholderia ubonensis]KVD78178.1 hypothetical protein WI88_22155 [Burkholderia ubonensis]
MEALRRYLKTKTPDGQRDFARRVGSTVSSMRKSISTNQRFGIARAIAIEVESGGAVNACSLTDKINVAQILEWAKRRTDNPEFPGMA